MQTNESFLWNRNNSYSTYLKILAHYQAISIFENKKGNNLLDIGSNDGYITNILSTNFSEVIGLEPSEFHLNIAKINYPHIKFYQSSLENFKYNGLFDTITIICTLTTVEDPIYFLNKAASFLSNDGVLIIQVGNYEAVNRKIATIMGTLTDEKEMSPFDIKIGGKKRMYNMDLLINDVSKANLKILSKGGIFYKTLSNSQINWLLENGLWDSGFGWERDGQEKEKDWRNEFCRALYEYGKTKPNDCNIIYVVATK